MVKETPKARLERCLRQVEERPDSAVAHFNLGLAYTKTGRTQSAEKAYLDALERDPDLVEAWVNLGGVRLLQWNFAGCLEATREAVARRDDLVLAHYNMGQAHLYLGDSASLLECCRRVLELDPEHAAAHYHAAVALLALDDLGGAKRHLAEAINLGHRPNPEFMKALEKAERSQQVGPPVLELGAQREGEDSQNP